MSKLQQGSSPRSVKVIFIVDEYPNVVREIKYKNAHHARDEELDGITGAQARLAAQSCVEPNRLPEHYRILQDAKAATSRAARSKRAAIPRDTRVVFNITEGPIVRVRHVTFTGNDSLATSARLRTQIGTSQRFLFST